MIISYNITVTLNYYKYTVTYINIQYTYTIVYNTIVLLCIVISGICLTILTIA